MERADVGACLEVFYTSINELFARWNQPPMPARRERRPGLLLRRPRLRRRRPGLGRGEARRAARRLRHRHRAGGDVVPVVPLRRAGHPDRRHRARPPAPPASRAGQPGRGTGSAAPHLHRRPAAHLGRPLRHVRHAAAGAHLRGPWPAAPRRAGAAAGGCRGRPVPRPARAHPDDRPASRSISPRCRPTCWPSSTPPTAACWVGAAATITWASWRTAACWCATAAVTARRWGTATSTRAAAPGRSPCATRRSCRPSRATC